MTKRYWIIIMVQSGVIVLLLVYAFAQRTAAQSAQGEARAQQAIAERSVHIAESAREEAYKQKTIADQNAAEAMRQVEMARQLALKCK